MKLELLPPTAAIESIETRAVLKKLTLARASLAELEGTSSTIPNKQILIDTLLLQEAKDSSAIENIITTHDEMYRSTADTKNFPSPSSKEVYKYGEALKVGFQKVKENGFISIKEILLVQEIIEGNDAGIRKLPGTVLKNDLTGEIIYTPPQDYVEILELMSNLEKFINDEIPYDADPLIKMAIAHHQFESIHPFFDGNGRTGRVLNILYLIKEGLLSLPILYLSRYLIKNRPKYYELIQKTRTTGEWEEWLLYVLDGVEITSKETTKLIKEIKILMMQAKQKIRNEEAKMYSQDLINNLFRHPYTKVELLQDDLGVSRITATKYLNRLAEIGILSKLKMGRTNYYINRQLFELLKEL